MKNTLCFVFACLLLNHSAGVIFPSEASAKTFMTATPEHILDAVESCESIKGDLNFDAEKLASMGWSVLETSFPKTGEYGSTMYRKAQSGASISITGDKSDPTKACLIIGWANPSKANAARDLISSKLGITFEQENEKLALAELNDWRHSIMILPGPSEQVRVMYIISPIDDE